MTTLPNGRPLNGRAAGAAAAPAPRHFLDLSDFSGDEIRRMLDASADMKAIRRKGARAAERPLVGKTLAMVFDRPRPAPASPSTWRCANWAARR